MKGPDSPGKGAIFGGGGRSKCVLSSKFFDHLLPISTVPPQAVVHDPIGSVQLATEGSRQALRSHQAYQHSKLRSRAVLARSQTYIEDNSSLPVTVNTHAMLACMVID